MSRSSLTRSSSHISRVSNGSSLTTIKGVIAGTGTIHSITRHLPLTFSTAIESKLISILVCPGDPSSSWCASSQSNQRTLCPSVITGWCQILRVQLLTFTPLTSALMSTGQPTHGWVSICCHLLIKTDFSKQWNLRIKIRKSWPFRKDNVTREQVTSTYTSSKMIKNLIYANKLSLRDKYMMQHSPRKMKLLGK